MAFGVNGIGNIGGEKSFMKSKGLDAILQTYPCFPQFYRQMGEHEQNNVSNWACNPSKQLFKGLRDA
jgi:hypothetical protein